MTRHQDAPDVAYSADALPRLEPSMKWGPQGVGTGTRVGMVRVGEGLTYRIALMDAALAEEGDSAGEPAVQWREVSGFVLRLPAPNDDLVLALRWEESDPISARRAFWWMVDHVASGRSLSPALTRRRSATDLLKRLASDVLPDPQVVARLRALEPGGAGDGQ